MKNIGRLVCGALLVGSFGAAMAQDVHNLSEGQPVSIEDAYPVAVGERQLELFFAFDTVDDFDLFEFRPQVQWGLTQDWEASVSLPFFWSDDDSDLGDLRLKVLWGPKAQNDPGLAYAIAAEADIPTNTNRGQDDDEVDTRLKLILTQPLDEGPAHSRLHFNLAWLQSGGDSEGVSYGLGYSQLMNPYTVLAADIVRLDPENGDTSDLLEFGFRRQSNPNQIWSLGFRFGLDNSAPDFGVTLGWQTRF